MKRFLFLLTAFLAFALASQAQATVTMPLSAGDTLTNAGTVTKTFSVTGGYSGIVVQPVITKISGTVAGTVKLYESLDGVNWIDTKDSITLSNVTTNTGILRQSAPTSTHYKLTATGSGTESAVLRVYYVLKRYQN